MLKTEMLSWMIFESVRDLFEQHPEDFKIVFGEDFKIYKEGCDTVSEEEMWDSFLDEYLGQTNDAYYQFAGYWVKKNKYKATIVDVKYFDEFAESDGVPKWVIDIEQVVPTTKEDLVELIEGYCAEKNIVLSEVLVEKMVPKD